MTLASKKGGNKVEVIIHNVSDDVAELYWMDFEGRPQKLWTF
jgi:hypothetical protein